MSGKNSWNRENKTPMKIYLDNYDPKSKLVEARYTLAEISYSRKIKTRTSKAACSQATPKQVRCCSLYFVPVAKLLCCIIKNKRQSQFASNENTYDLPAKVTVIEIGDSKY
jgi:hypothetical protein